MSNVILTKSTRSNDLYQDYTVREDHRGRQERLGKLLVYWPYIYVIKCIARPRGLCVCIPFVFVLFVHGYPSNTPQICIVLNGVLKRCWYVKGYLCKLV